MGNTAMEGRELTNTSCIELGAIINAPRGRTTAQQLSLRLMSMGSSPVNISSMQSTGEVQMLCFQRVEVEYAVLYVRNKH